MNPKCPWCEGRGITAQLIPAHAAGEEMGCFMDRCCSVCKGRGTVDPETYRRWTGTVPSEEVRN